MCIFGNVTCWAELSRSYIQGCLVYIHIYINTCIYMPEKCKNCLLENQRYRTVMEIITVTGTSDFEWLKIKRMFTTHFSPNQLISYHTAINAIRTKERNICTVIIIWSFLLRLPVLTTHPFRFMHISGTRIIVCSWYCSRQATHTETKTQACITTVSSAVWQWEWALNWSRDFTIMKKLFHHPSIISQWTFSFIGIRITGYVTESKVHAKLA